MEIRKPARRYRMKKKEKEEKAYKVLTVELPLDLILKCYAICIEQRITFDEFVAKAIEEALKTFEAEKPPRKKAKK